jgi:hypothetical protein
MIDERVIAYLLEELPEAEQERFEEECFAEDDWPAQLNLVEEDLIDDYLRDALAPEQRSHFEQNYLTTDARMERVRMAAALLQHVDERQAAVIQPAVAATPANESWGERFRAFWSSPAWMPRAAVVSLAVVAVVVASAWWLARAPAPKTFAELSLSVSASDRASGVQPGTVKLPLNADALRISLTLPVETSTATRHRVELENSKGEVQTLEIAGRNARSVSVVIPASRLARGRYAARLYTTDAAGTEQRINGSYFFNVE